MTIDKAIEILNRLELPIKTAEEYDAHLAVRLGVEALKAIAKLRHYPFPDEILCLPSETKEKEKEAGIDEQGNQG